MVAAPSTTARPGPRGARAPPRRAARRARSEASAPGGLGPGAPAKRSERPAWPASSTLTPKRSPSWSTEDIFARRSIEMSTRGGLSETDMNAFAVIPCTWSPVREVRTVTPGARTCRACGETLSRDRPRAPDRARARAARGSRANDSPNASGAPDTAASPSTASNSLGAGFSMGRFCRSGPGS